MIIYDDKKNAIINMVVQFFMNYVVKYDLKSYFKIYISNNMVEDYALFDKKYTPKSKNYAGLTILPDNKKNVIQILISEKSCTPDVILHELAHMYDFILFASYFCKNKLYKVKCHKYYQTFIYWSEFHVKQIDIPYLQMLFDIYKKLPREKWMLDFKNNIKSFYFPEYTNKYLGKKNPTIKEIMWYFGEVFVCNLYDENNTYNIPQEIIEKSEFDICLLYQMFEYCSNFKTFAENIKIFYKYFQ